ncbi:MAG: hypothetical protein AAF799_35070 [Myxococcota bacterium]
MSSELRGPIEDRPWPTTLPGRVVRPGAEPRIRGYDLHGDLVRHYGFAEIALIALHGQAPAGNEGRLFELSLSLLSPCSVAEAPSHGAQLVRRCGARSAAVLSAGAVALSEQAQAVVDEHRELLAWLDAPESVLPPAYQSTEPAETDAVARFAEHVRALGITLPILEQTPTFRAALLAALHHCGLRDPERLQVAWVLARLPTVLAEALEQPSGELRSYPIDLPHYAYVPSDDEPSP